MSHTARSSLLEQHLWRSYLLPPSRITTAMSTSRFFLLPRELQLAILDNLSPWDYVTFALASYSRLRIIYPDYFPRVTRARLRMMRTRPSPGTRDLLRSLPNEMIDNIARHIRQPDLLRWVFAHYYSLAHSNPPLVRPVDLTNARELYRAWLDEDGG
jgi:hypothetical protein